MYVNDKQTYNYILYLENEALFCKSTKLIDIMTRNFLLASLSSCVSLDTRTQTRLPYIPRLCTRTLRGKKIKLVQFLYIRLEQCFTKGHFAAIIIMNAWRCLLVNVMVKQTYLCTVIKSTHFARRKVQLAVRLADLRLIQGSLYMCMRVYY